MSEELKNNTGYFPQDASVDRISLLTASGETVELKKLMVELSYFEDIYSFVVSGHVIVVDALGLLESLQITGNEFLEISFGKTKNGPTNITKVFRVYKIGDRKPSPNLNSEAFTLYFCSEELLLSEQTKISKSYAGKKIDKIITEILQDKLKVNSKKINIIEPTTGVYDFTVPRLKPFEAISWLSLYARPSLTGALGADMLFFENRDGFNFNSIQTLMSRDVYDSYTYQPKNLPTKLTDIEEKISTVLEYEFIKTHDLLNEINSGTFANRLISIDPLTRSYNVTDFDYESYKSQINEKTGVLSKSKNRLNKTQNENYEGNFKVVIGNSNQSNTPYIKERVGSVAKDIFVENYIPYRTAQLSLANYIVAKLVIPGDSGISAGRTIDFNLLRLGVGENGEKELDSYYSGKYLVTAVRHVMQSQGAFQTILEIAKESTPTTLAPAFSSALRKEMDTA